MSKRVFIAGPYTKDDPVVNTHRAVQAATAVLDAGHFVFCPHLSMFWHFLTPRPYETWTAHDLGWLRICDAMLRLEGESLGADDEERHAQEWHIPIFYDLTALLAWLGTEGPSA